MKKVIYTLAILTSVAFASCNGQLNDDIDDLEGNFAGLQAENDALAAENDALQNALDDVSSDLDNVSDNLTDGGINVTSPVKLNHNYTDDGVTKSEILTFLNIQGFYFENNSSQLIKSDASRVDLIALPATTYTHYIEIYFNSLNFDNVSLQFNYNSDTGEATLDRFNFDTTTTYYSIRSNSTDVEYTLTVNSFDTSTGDISLDFDVEYDSDFGADFDSGTLNFSINDILKDGSNGSF